jgi:hypothetical protein
MKKQTLMFICVTSLVLTGCNSTMMSQATSLATNLVSSDSGAAQGFNSEYTVNAALASQDPLLASYGTSVILMFKAQEVWLSSIGHAEGSANLKAERLALESGAVIDGDLIDRHAQLSVETNALIKESVDKGTDLSDQGKVEFAAGWVPYLTGLWQSYEVAKKAGDYATTVAHNAANINVTNAFDTFSKGTVLTTLVASVPDIIEMQYDTFGLIQQYAKDQDIEVPEDATSALSEISL